jgi:hypothetical protein
MIINIIDRITVYDEKIEVQYKIKLREFDDTPQRCYDGQKAIENDVFSEGEAVCTFFCPEFVKSGQSPTVLTCILMLTR